MIQAQYLFKEKGSISVAGTDHTRPFHQMRLRNNASADVTPLKGTALTGKIDEAGIVSTAGDQINVN